jgi:sugar lactone lactonase YvrE
MISLVVILSASFSQLASALSTGQPASLVIGQSSFTTSTCKQGGHRELCDPFGSAFDSSGNLWVADTGNSRVLEFKPPFSNGQSPSLVIGQSSFNTNACSTTQSGVCPIGLAFDSSGNLWVADFSNSRVLEFKPPFSNGQLASLIIGQSSFTTNACSATQSGLCGPQGLAFDSSGNLWVVHEGNNRVLEFAAEAHRS